MEQWQGLLLYVLVFFAVFYLLIILPKHKQDKKHRQLMESLKPHDKVVTIGGICGEIKKVKEETIILKVLDNTELEVLKKAVAYKQE
ncbi:MAG: preprotein translocase subunit YajC [Syntrophomonadaceae bacterium]|nr:preprotein translocase subunit YajC [Syntrophomonadaceae bacterium]